MEIINWVLANKVEVIQLVLALLGAFSIIAKLTPTKVDDNILGFIAKIIHTLGLTK
jgi:hypothetical protein